MPTGIEWTDEAWNVTTGCTKVGPGCLNCYAETIAKRFPARFYPGGTFIPWTVKAQRESDQPAVMLWRERLDQPLRWKRPRRIFVDSMSDLFHENVPWEFIDRVFAVMALAPQHTFQVLTKRPDRMVEYFYYLNDERIQRTLAPYNDEAYPMVDWEKVLLRYPLPNAWLGVSVENQRYADERIPLLLATPAAVRFISAEPLLSSLDLSSWLPCPACDDGPHDDHQDQSYEGGIDWVIAGGESGPKARPMHPDWVRSIRGQCRRAGVPFFFKQWGTWLPTSQRDIQEGVYGSDGPDFVKLGKGKAGHYLDNMVYQQFPEVR